MSQRDHCGQKSEVRFLAQAVAKGGGTAGPAQDQGGHHDEVGAWESTAVHSKQHRLN